MPWLTFKAWDDRIAVLQVRRQNAEARADWNARIAEMKRKGG